MVQIDPTQLGLEMGGSAVIGAVIGFAAKKIAKLIAVIIGLELVLFKFLESRGVLEVNWDRIANASSAGAETVQSEGQSFINAFIGTAGVGAGFVGGFLLGFKKA